MRRLDIFEVILLAALCAAVGTLAGHFLVVTNDLIVGSTRRVGPPDIYPTVPGKINPAITQANISQNICNPSWSTKSERPPSSYTSNLKAKQLKQLGYADQNPADYEEDHLISLELGGNPTDPMNLWPEPYKASIPDGGAKSKDTVENYLHSEVCAGKLTLQAAQTQIVNDWYVVLKQIKTLGAGASDPDDQ